MKKEKKGDKRLTAGYLQFLRQFLDAPSPEVYRLREEAIALRDPDAIRNLLRADRHPRAMAFAEAIIETINRMKELGADQSLDVMSSLTLEQLTYAQEPFHEFFGFLLPLDLVDMDIKTAMDHLDRNASLTLDVGSGVSPQLMYLLYAKALHGKVVGFDASPTLVRKGNELAKRLSLNMCFETGNAIKLPFESKQFDQVVSYDMLQFLEHWKEALWEMVRVMKLGGSLTIRYIFLHDLRNIGPDEVVYVLSRVGVDAKVIRFGPNVRKVIITGTKVGLGSHSLIL